MGGTKPEVCANKYIIDNMKFGNSGSLDSYHYFGNNDTYFEKVLKPILRKDAIVAIAFPGMKYEVHGNIPEEMKSLWEAEALEMWHSIDWWKPKFIPYLKGFQIAEMDCFDRAWNDWLSCDNPYAVEDRLMLLLANKFTFHLFPFFVEKDIMITATAKGEIYHDRKRKNACRTAL